MREKRLHWTFLNVEGLVAKNNVCTFQIPTCVVEVNQPPQETDGPDPAPPSLDPVAAMKVHPPRNERIEAESPPVSIIPSVSPVEVHTPEPNHVPVPLPMPISKPMPTLVNGARASPTQSYHLPMQKSHPDFDAEIIGDDLDDLLDQAGPGPTESPMVRSWEFAANVGKPYFLFIFYFLHIQLYFFICFCFKCGLFTIMLKQYLM